MGQQRMKEMKKLVKKLMKRDHPEAHSQMAALYEDGNGVLQSDTRALELYTRAAELGHTEAYLFIGSYYGQGIAVEQDESKAFEFFEVGAKKGSYNAHIWLAKFHGSNGNMQKFIEHLKVAAKAGCQISMDGVMAAYRDKLLSKDELTQTLRAFQVSSNEMKSKDRENARLMEESRKKGERLPAHLFK